MSAGFQLLSAFVKKGLNRTDSERQCRATGRSCLCRFHCNLRQDLLWKRNAKWQSFFVNYISMYVAVCEHYARRQINFKKSMNKFVKQNIKSWQQRWLKEGRSVSSEADVCRNSDKAEGETKQRFWNDSVDSFILKVRHMYNLITLFVHFQRSTYFEPLTWVHLQEHII
jgi:hypothetical protein